MTGDNKLIDACGVPLANHWQWLPARAADFPRPKAIRDKEAVRAWRHAKVRLRCWWCDQPTEQELLSPYHGEVHHIVRHDAPWAFAWLCATCHRLGEDSAITPANLFRLLQLKHEHDQWNTNWVLLAIGRGRFLPTE